MLLIEYHYTVPRSRSGIEMKPMVPEQGDDVLVQDYAPRIFKGKVKAVAEPVFADAVSQVTYLLYIEVPSGQLGIQELAAWVDQGNEVGVMMSPLPKDPIDV